MEPFLADCILVELIVSSLILHLCASLNPRWVLSVVLPFFFPSSDNTIIVTKNLPYRGMSWERGKLEFPATENLETRICQRLPFCFLQNKTWTSGLLSSDHLPFLYFLQCSPAKCVLLRLRRGVLTLEDVFRSCTCKFLFFVWIWTGFQYCTKTWFLLFEFVLFYFQSVQIVKVVVFFLI